MSQTYIILCDTVRSGIWEKESIIGVQWFQKNPNPRVHRSGGISASLSHWNGGLSGWELLSPLNTNDGFYLSHITQTNPWEE